MIASIGKYVHVAQPMSNGSWKVGAAKVLNRERVQVQEQEGGSYDRLLLTVKFDNERVASKVWADEIGVL